MDSAQNTPGFASSVVILFSVIFFYCYYYFATSDLPEKICKKINRQVPKKVAVFLVKKGSGLLFLGVLPGLFYFFFLNQDFSKFGFSFNHLISNYQIIFLLILIIAAILFVNQKINRQNNSLQVELTDWTMSLFLINAFGWVIYLLGYEFLFRGILLFECYSSFGFWPAIAINIAIYSAIHMVNGKEQTIGALIFGGIASYLTLTKGTILIPIFMHISLSVFSDYFSIIYNQNLNFVK
ncbi:MAG TPA: CPBP family intramembrane metalloprotease [Draconibacterium sp.]|nr:CPBP family intramembrane metalloprotease [Draconibacterium sp.]